jgi:hypothetical protein
MAAIPLKHDDIYYPESDGRPMAETDLHMEVMFDLIHGLRRYYADDPDVYVSGNLLVYDVPGNPKSSFSPDTFVVKGVPKGRDASTRSGKRAAFRASSSKSPPTAPAARISSSRKIATSASASRSTSSSIPWGTTSAPASRDTAWKEAATIRSSPPRMAPSPVGPRE